MLDSPNIVVDYDSTGMWFLKVDEQIIFADFSEDSNFFTLVNSYNEYVTDIFGNSFIPLIKYSDAFKIMLEYETPTNGFN